MDDELVNHATYVFEDLDLTDPSTAVSQDLDKNFIDAVRIKLDEDSESFSKRFISDVRSLSSLYSRTLFFNLLAFGYQNYEKVA